MLFGDCNIRIAGLYPRLDRDSVGDYYFSIGIKKEFAKKAFNRELGEKGYENLQKLGKDMIKKVFGYDENESMIYPPYKFVENKEGKLTCLFSNLTVPGNACGLDSDFWNLERDLENINEYQNFIEYHPHNIDNPRQCYAFLSLVTTWDDIMQAILEEKNNQNS